MSVVDGIVKGTSLKNQQCVLIIYCNGWKTNTSHGINEPLETFSYIAVNVTVSPHFWHCFCPNNVQDVTPAVHAGLAGGYLQPQRQYT